MEYGVQTHNKFAFLDEDVGAPEETLTKAEEEKKKAAAHPPEKKVTKPAAVTKTPPATIPTKEAEKHEKKDNEGGQLQKPAAKFRNDRGGGGGNRGRDIRDRGQNRGVGPQRQRHSQQNDRRELDSQNDREKRMPNGRTSQNNEFNKESGIDGRPPRRTGPPRGDRGGQRGGYVGGPRGGGQRRNRNEQKEENKVEDSKPNESENTVEKPAEENEASEVTDGQKVNDENVDNTGVDENKGDQEEEMVPRGKTYEEYKAELTQKQIEAVQFNTRKPGEGGDEKIYQKLVPLKKPENTKGKSEDLHEETTQHKEKREKPLSIDVAFVNKRFGGSKTGFAGVDRNERPPPRGGDYRQGGGFGGGRGYGPLRDNYGSGHAGPSNRRQTNKQGSGEFTLENDQFPALGAK